MKRSIGFFLILAGVIASAVAVTLVAQTTATAGLPARAVSASKAPVVINPPVVFVHDPAWPSYAQTEITVDPEPPILGRPTKICAWVVNNSDTPQEVTLDFGLADFGIGLDFGPIGSRTLTVPPHSSINVCVVWVPRLAGHWCVQVILHQHSFPDQVSQRNLDIWEVLVPGVPAITQFPVRNPLTQPVIIQLNPIPNTHLGNRGIRLDPPVTQLASGGQITATLVVTPPVDGELGSREPIVDVEAYAQIPGLPQGQLIGGFRKMDWPPVPLHRQGDPPYAESEISVEPYPPLAGEPTRICVELRNLSDVPRGENVQFEIAPAFGIGLPFTPIDVQNVVIQPYGMIKVCTTWIPPNAGSFSVQVQLFDPQQIYAPQKSQSSLDVNEILLPGAPMTDVIQVRNPNPFSTTIYLTATRVSSFFDVFLDNTVLPNMGPNEVRAVTLHVTLDLGSPPEDGTLVADIEASFYDNLQQPVLIGGMRKIYRPPIPLHHPEEPAYAESEISIDPYPPRAGEPTQVCVDLRNPTNMTQTVAVDFGIGNFGIGLEFRPIDSQPVTLPPFSATRACTTWVPPIGGHFSVQIILHQPGYHDVFSQRNLDVAEYLRPKMPDWFTFPVGNPFDKSITVTLGLVQHLPGWEVSLSTTFLPNLQPHQNAQVTMIVTPTDDLSPLEDGTPIVDVEAYVDQQLLGGFRKIFRPPIPIHLPQDPPYAEREITIDPYPPRAGEPTRICVDLRNPTAVTQTVVVQFAIANFGIGLPFTPIQNVTAVIPPFSIIRKCVTWVPPYGGHFCVQVSVFDPQQQYAAVRSQRNMDVDEVFVAGQTTKPFVFLVGNPLAGKTNIQLAALNHLKGWQAILEPPMLLDVAPGEFRPVTLTVQVPTGPLPQDETPVVDVEGYAAGQLIGGFRKIYRPPVPVHAPGDPPYAESEISINPYPPDEREPTEICVDVRNPTNQTQTITVTFAVANFGIGLPFHDIARPIAVTVPANSSKRVCITWVPPFGGHFCAQVTLTVAGHTPVLSQRNMDISEILIPGRPAPYTFMVGNPTGQAATVTLGLIPHIDGWVISLSQDVLTNLQPGAVRPVTLTVTPAQSMSMPLDGAPVVDVEGYIGAQLIGGFRKIYRPPVPIHVPGDPVYAESEIFVDPYPTQAGLPTLIGAVIHNPTNVPQAITVTFGVANFGIGLPFTTTGIMTPVMVVNIPPLGAALVKTVWQPWFNGHFCVQIILQSAGRDPVWSQRNIDVGEPLRPDQAHARVIPVGNPLSRPVTISMALISHRGPDWSISLTPTVLVDVLPGTVRPVTLTVIPPSWAGLADEQPIADVEAYVDGVLIGGVRKIAKPPVPLHKPQDRPYAESEISVTPYPVQAGKPTTITTAVMNTSDVTQTIRVLFGVANFGVGIPFTNANIVPTMTVVTLGPGISMTVKAVWTPSTAGHWCIQIELRDANPATQYPSQRSQRNVDVEQHVYKPCQPFTKTFILQNPTAQAITVTLGASAINLPQGWTYSTDITQTVLGAFKSITVTITITPPCGLARAPVTVSSVLDTGGASGPPSLNVEGYSDAGELIGGVQVQLESLVERRLFLPIVRRP